MYFCTCALDVAGDTAGCHQADRDGHVQTWAELEDRQLEANCKGTGVLSVCQHRTAVIYYFFGLYCIFLLKLCHVK